ncbi:retropepsin-like aspartic protease [Phenylobacterium sp.]|uniref:retropepsin-like aspartic protease n=1 Tax=Phenylobacterium sp. TaxID=1871053 RepID=UPI0035B0C41D
MGAIAALIARPGRSSAQDAASPQGPPLPSIDGGAFLETAFDHALRLTVPVYLDAEGPFAFVVDTGSNRTVVATEVAARCGFEAAGTAQVHGIISAEPAPLVRVRRLRVGSVISSGLRLPVVAGARLGADGILGIDMMRSRRVKLDFDDQTFSIIPSATDPFAELARGRNSRLSSPRDPVTVPARYRSGQLLLLDVEAAGVPVIAFLDSGSQVTVGNSALRRAAFADHPRLAGKAIRSELISATGQHAPADFAALPSFRIARQTFEAPLVAFSDLHIFTLWGLQEHPAMLIGVDTLRRFSSVAFDFGRKLITFWPAEPPNELVRRAGSRGSGGG